MNIANHFEVAKANGKTYISFKVKRRNNGVRCDAKLFLSQDILFIEGEKYFLTDKNHIRLIQRDYQKKVITQRKELKIYPCEAKQYLRRMCQFESMGSKIAAI